MHFRREGRGLEPEKGRGAVGAIDFAAGFGERVENEGALLVLQVAERARGGLRSRVGFARRAPDGAAGGAEGEVEMAVARADDGAFDDVLQLAHVAGPLVGLE